jgi:signal transduction histidine kinase
MALLGSMAIAFALAAAGPYMTFPPTLSVRGDRLQVESVSVGSWPWIWGVRPGQLAVPWSTEGDRTVGFEIRVGETVVGVNPTESPSNAFAGFGTALIAALAFILWRRRLPGAALALALSGSVAVWPLYPFVGLPVALALVVLPALIGLSAVSYLTPSRLPDFRMAMASLIALVGFFVLPLLAPSLPWPWEILWAMPAISAIGIVLTSSTVAILAALRAGGPSVALNRARRLLAEALPQTQATRARAVNDERARLAAELHNRILPELGQAILELDDRRTATRTRLQNVSEELRRSLSHRQIAVLQRAGLVPALRAFVHALDSPVPIRFVCRGGEDLPPAVALAAYRIGQAAIGNAAVHSGADNITVSLDDAKDGLALEISDDGVGIESDAEDRALARGALGLADMRVQAAAVGGVLDVAGIPGSGTVVRFTWCQ